jgi:trans-2,3-dihydro-3-hydroxyanthranilate isomerase
VFTPERESPFGGHSAVGTATVLHRHGALGPGPAVQQCGDRLLPLMVDADGVTLAGRDALPVAEVDAGPLLRALSLTPADLTGPARAAGFGPLFHFLPTTPGAMDRARLDPADPVWAETGDAFLHCWDADGRTASARMFAPGYGIPEDPACASAVLALGVALVHAGQLPRTDGEHAFRVRQGSHAGRPATLRGTATVAGGGVVRATVAGTALPAGGGVLAPPVRIP